jgi:hypothetical protein
MNFALALADRTVTDVDSSLDTLLRGVDIDKSDLVVDRLNRVLLQGRLSEPTRATLEKQALASRDASADTINVAQLAAMILGSPEFQRH